MNETVENVKRRGRISETSSCSERSLAVFLQVHMLI